MTPDGRSPDFAGHRCFDPSRCQAPVGLSKSLAAYSCGGSHGIGACWLFLTVFPFHPGYWLEPPGTISRWIWSEGIHCNSFFWRGIGRKGPKQLQGVALKQPCHRSPVGSPSFRTLFGAVARSGIAEFPHIPYLRRAGWPGRRPRQPVANGRLLLRLHPAHHRRDRHVRQHAALRCEEHIWRAVSHAIACGVCRCGTLPA